MKQVWVEETPKLVDQATRSLQALGARVKFSRRTTYDPTSRYSQYGSSYSSSYETHDIELQFNSDGVMNYFLNMVVNYQPLLDADFERRTEEQLREQNPTLKDAYDQYRLLLKLITGENKK
jgi:hypothetical protein